MDLFLEGGIILIFLQLAIFTKTENSPPAERVYDEDLKAPVERIRWSPATEIQCGDIFPNVCQKSKYRTFSGSCNNQDHPTWGMGFTRNSRLLPADYADGIHSPRVSENGRPLPLSRTLSYVLSPDIEMLDENFTLAAMQYGQIIAHDLTFPDIDPPTGFHVIIAVTDCCTIDGRLSDVNKEFCYPITIPDDDPVYKKNGIKCLRGFTRTNTDLDRGCNLLNGSVEQLTIASGFLDLSQLYGSNAEEAASLREEKSGRLIVEKRNNQEWPPIIKSQYGFCNGTTNVCYKSGDWRVNQNPQLAVLQIILFREHNRVADVLVKLNPHWRGEKIYQEARRIVIAEHQHISYYEWLPIFLGVKNSHHQKIIYRTKNFVNDYNSSVNPSVSIEFATDAFRYFHTFIAGNLNLVNESRYSSSHLRLSDHLDNLTILEKKNNFDDFARGLCTQAQEAANQYHTKEITNFMSRGQNKLGQDLRATDIHRSRERGIASYNKYRVYCGLRKASKWKDFLDYISPENVEILSQLYETPEDVDLGVGAILEKLVHKTLVGPTFLCILNEQFFRTRVGDRFWYENGDFDTSFSIEQLNEIRKASISRLMCDNSNNIKSMQPKGFVQISKKNPLVKCDEIPSINFYFWKDLEL